MNSRNQGCTVGTKHAYEQRADALSRMAVRELRREGEHASPGELVSWFVGAKGRWRPPTIRQYRGAIRYGLENRCRKPDGHAAALEALEQLNAAPVHF